MTSVEQRDLSLNPKEITEISDSNADLSLPMPLSPLISLASLDRCISNPLVRGYSNVSVSSDNEGAHFVPYGRGHDDIANATDLSSFGFNPSFLTDTDGLMQVSPLHVVQSKVMANAAECNKTHCFFLNSTIQFGGTTEEAKANRTEKHEAGRRWSSIEHKGHNKTAT
eukprot:670607_1